VSVTIFRIAQDRTAYRANDLSGQGASSSGGRWNSRGKRVVYAATTVSLAVLETVVHLSGPPAYNRYVVEIAVPSDLWAARTVAPSKIPGWDALPASAGSIDFGDAWLRSAASVLLMVPSIVVPREMNVLINPDHPDAHKITAVISEKFLYDPRLTKQGFDSEK